MRNKVNKTATSILFLLSPFLSLPLILKGVVEKKRWAVTLLLGVFAFVSLMYIPEPTNDRKYYYSLYEYYQITDWKTFINDLSTKTDFVFYTLIYIAAKASLPLNVLFFLIFFLTLNNYFTSFFTVSKLYNPGNLFALFIFLILFSFQLKGLYSGVRFYFAASFIVRAFMASLSSSSLKSGLPYLIVGIFTHFSTAVFAPFYFLFHFLKVKDGIVLSIFLLSFAFLFIPSEFLADRLVSIFNFSEVYENKITGYLGEEDYLEESKQIGNFNNYLRLIFNTLWLYVAYYYFVIHIKRKSSLKNLLFLILAATNIFISSSGTYYRLMFVPIIFFILLLLRDYSQGVKNRKIIYLVFLMVSLNFLGNAYALRKIFARSLIKIESLTGPTMLLKKDLKYNEIQ